MTDRNLYKDVEIINKKLEEIEEKLDGMTTVLFELQTNYIKRLNLFEDKMETFKHKINECVKRVNQLESKG